MSEQVIDRVEVIHEGWGRFLILHMRMSDGTPFKRQVEDHGDAACVLPYDPTRRCVMLVRQLRVPLAFRGEADRLLEAPAGILDETDPAACARREATEETGLHLRSLEKIGAFWPMPGSSTERIHLYLAGYSKGDQLAKGGGLANEHEEIEVVEMPIREAIALVEAGELSDLKTFAALQALRLRHPELCN